MGANICKSRQSIYTKERPSISLHPSEAWKRPIGTKIRNESNLSIAKQNHQINIVRTEEDEQMSMAQSQSSIPQLKRFSDGNADIDSFINRDQLKKTYHKNYKEANSDSETESQFTGKVFDTGSMEKFNDLNGSKENSSTNFSSLLDTVNELRTKTQNNPLFVEYTEASQTEDAGEQVVRIEPLFDNQKVPNLLTLTEYVECYGFLDDISISKICEQIFSGLELLFKNSYFHGSISIDNIMINQISMNIKMMNYGLYNCIYKENPLDLFEGSKMDLFCVGILVLKLLGKLRLDMPLDLGELQHRVDVLKSIYKNESLSYILKSFLDKAFDEEASLTKMLIHPFITVNPQHTNSESRESMGIRNTLTQNMHLGSIKESITGEDKSDFTFGSGQQKSSSPRSSDSSYIPPELRKFLTKGSGFGRYTNLFFFDIFNFYCTSFYSSGTGSEEQKKSIELIQHRFSETNSQHSILPSNSPAIPLRYYDRTKTKPICNPPENPMMSPSEFSSTSEIKGKSSSQQAKLIKIENKYRQTLLLNPCDELPEMNDTEEDDQEIIKNLSKSIIIVPPKNNI
ncbi:unnamed protein product [Moneuplotes crassus]|uniref:Protein kinase domain-containing protein n=1 Tax=Euplotes crassus TaxID=5936 RepID=A0AAD1U6T0_EUPCR|nr:unnamed protein product [Moneuplotes crassus]